MMKLKVISAQDKERACGAAGDTAELVFAAEYAENDRILLETDAPQRFCVVQLEDSMPPALVYVPATSMLFTVPPANNRPNYSPKSFTGACHYLRARYATQAEINARRNLALNVYDQHENNTFFPHAAANVETRGEAVFAARNAIDGIFANASHGNYPYQSWGINRNPDAALTLSFGRRVTVDEVRFTLRADYPHDNYWTSATLHFDDGSAETFTLTNACLPQVFTFAPRTITQCTLDTLLMADGPSPFPALTQLELYGTEAGKEAGHG